MSLDKVIFKDKKFSDLLEEIYNNQKKKEKQISGLIAELSPLVQDTGDATIIVPIIKEYLEVGVRNDEQLIKVATIVQRILQNQTTAEDGLGISEEEKAQLMQSINSLTEGTK